MALPTGAAPTFAQPFEMLEACHERIARTLGLLQRLRAHVAKHGADKQARQAALDVMRYFDLAAPQHHRDEELHVFPRLLAQGDPALAELAATLQQDHHRMEAAWADARAVLARLQTGALQSLDAAADEVLDAFSALHANHLRTEESLAFPAALTLLDADAVAAMGEEMRVRRGAA